MNKEALLAICQQFKLGLPTGNVTSVTGGLLHQMWKVNTNKGSYAIKQLSQDIQLTPKTIQSYEITEQIAEQLKQLGIPAVHAIASHNHYLYVIAHSGFFVYPWVNAKALQRDSLSENHALRIASILAKIHQLNIDVPQLKEPEFDIHSNEKINELILLACDSNCIFSSVLKEYQPQFIKMNQAYHQSISLLKEHVVVSHGDLDQKNVLWDHYNNPILIDWESARKLNPTYEIINAGLDWSGITTKVFDSAIFTNMIKAYSAAGGIINEKHLYAAFYGVLGNWLNWMVYNIVRACNADNVEQQIIGNEQVQQVVPTLIQLDSMIPDLVANVIHLNKN